jgi:hypothetical protein
VREATVATGQAKHELDEQDIDEADELGEIDGDQQEQYCFVWCLKHKKYEWHWIWRPVSAETKRKRKAKKAQQDEKGTAR